MLIFRKEAEADIQTACISSFRVEPHVWDRGLQSPKDEAHGYAEHKAQERAISVSG